jgi:hypothetical protein
MKQQVPRGAEAAKPFQVTELHKFHCKNGMTGTRLCNGIQQWIVSSRPGPVETILMGTPR